MDILWSSGKLSESDWHHWPWDDVQQWDLHWALSLHDMLNYWGFYALRQRLDSNAAVLPNSLAQSIWQRLDSKASKSGLLLPSQDYSSPLCMQCVGFQIQSLNFKMFWVGMWPFGAHKTVITWPKKALTLYKKHSGMAAEQMLFLNYGENQPLRSQAQSLGTSCPIATCNFMILYHWFLFWKLQMKVDHCHYSLNCNC